MAEATGELAFTIGGIFPQGNYVQYADPGISFSARANFHLSSLKAVSGWLDFGFADFGDEQSPVDIQIGSFQLSGEQQVNESSFALHGGLQFGSDSRRSFFRPRVGLAPGMYIFDTKTTVIRLDTDEVLVIDHDTQVKIGWRAVGGLDLFFSTDWGLSFEFIYDQVVDLNHSLEYVDNVATVKTGRAARYHSFMIGAVIPFEVLGF